MDDKTLQDLKNITPPTPSAEAKKQAISSAMDAFEMAGEKNAKNSQGMPNWLRPIHSIHQQLWSRLMKKQLVTRTILASGLVVCMSAVVLHMENPMVSELGAGGSGSKPRIIDMFKSKNSVSVNRQEKEAVLSNNRPHVDGLTFEQRTPESMARAELDKVAQPQAAPVPPMMPAPQRMIAKRAPAPKAESFAVMDMAVGSVAGAGARIMPLSMPAPGVPPHDGYVQPDFDGNDTFAETESNPLKQVATEPVSTFSVDVDTASYSYVRRALNNGRMPSAHSVRVEEMVNYFDYNYPLPQSAAEPFKPTVALYPTPWNQHTKLLHIGIKGHDIVPAKKPASNLVFLLDVSGSMNQQDKLPLLKNAFRMMVENLSENDTVSIVTYAGRAGTVLEPTKVAEKSKILNALQNLNAGGGTAGAQGIKQAYALAQENFSKDGVNRVLLATDGDFNVGISNPDELKKFIEKKRETGIFLSVLGFGQGNHNDALMQALAQNGNGNAAYIDTLNEARKVLVEEASSTLFPIAKDVKIQIEFNPAAISEYRLVGYETRILKREDFNNDKVDAGDIGSGHSVTAIYEVTPVGSKAQMIDDLRYQKAEEAPKTDASEYAFLKLRYKLPNESTSTLMEMPITQKQAFDSIDDVSNDVRFAASVAGFGQKLKGENALSGYGYDKIVEMATSARGEDAFGYRAEFVNLVRLAKSLDNQ